MPLWQTGLFRCDSIQVRPVNSAMGRRLHDLAAALMGCVVNFVQFTILVESASRWETDAA